VLRYTLRLPQLWVPDVTAWSLLFIAFFGAAWVLKIEGHVKVELLLDRLNPRTRRLFNTITSIISAIMWLAITWYTAKITWRLFRVAEPALTLIESPVILKAYLIGAIPVGSFLLFIQLLRRISSFVRDSKAS
jgi:TRAP-type C4-dicarboxylate transport system permease small subunit